MRLASPSFKRSIGPNIKILALPVGIILIVVLLFVGLIQIGYGRISSQVEGYRAAKEKEAVLSEKLNVLTQVNTSLPSADATVVAMPDKNPGAWVISQIRTVSQDNEVVLGNLVVSGSESDNSLNKIEMDVEVQAQDYASLFSFLQGLSNIAPVSTLDAAQITLEGTEATLEGNLKMSFYWSALPTSLPAINEAVSGLTSQEQDILSMIDDLRFPTFGLLSPAAPTDRQTPFN